MSRVGLNRSTMPVARQTGLLMLALVVPLASCSLVVDIDLPKQGSDNDCDFLDDTMPDGVDECVQWQFNIATLECELVPLDEDNDGFFPAVCLDHPTVQLTADQVDCDDTSNNGAVSFPGAPERCDGIDNDCDAKVDEGVLVPAVSDSPTVAFNDSPSDVAYAADPLAANSLGVAYTLPGPGDVPGAVVRDRSFASENADRFTVFTTDGNDTVAVAANADTVRSAGVDIASLGNNQYAVAFINQSGGRRLTAGVATQDRARTVFVESSVFSPGLPCTPADGDCETTLPPVHSPVIAVSGTNVLATAVRRSTTANECTDDIDEVRVVGNALIKRDFLRVDLGAGGPEIMFPALRPTAANPTGLDLGVIRADATPAVIGIPEAGFVVALPQTDNTLLLRTVTITDGVYAVATARDVVFSVENDAAPLLEPAFALSTAIDHDGNAETDPRRVLGLAFRRGCGGAGTVHVKLFNVDPENGRISAQSGAPRRLDGAGLATAISESRPTISFAPDQGNTWIVAYAKQRNLRSRVLSFDGTLHGSESTTLIADADRLGLTPSVFPTPSGSFGGARYGAMVDATIDNRTGIFTVHLGCFESD